MRLGQTRFPGSLLIAIMGLSGCMEPRAFVNVSEAGLQDVVLQGDGPQDVPGEDSVSPDTDSARSVSGAWERIVSSLPATPFGNRVALAAAVGGSSAPGIDVVSVALQADDPDAGLAGLGALNAGIPRLELSGAGWGQDALQELFSTLVEQSEDCSWGGRPVIVSSTDLLVVLAAAELLALNADLACLRDALLLGYRWTPTPDDPPFDSLLQRVSDLAAAGGALIELPHDLPRLEEVTARARLTRLRVGLYGFGDPADPSFPWAAALASHRETVDLVEVSGDPLIAREVLTSTSSPGLILLDMLAQSSDGSLHWFSEGGGPGAAPVEHVQDLSLLPEPPTWEVAGSGDCAPMAGPRLAFQGGASLPLKDVVWDPAGGVLVSAVVAFSALNFQGDTRTIVGKCEQSGWCLEFEKHLGQLFLQFAIHVDGEYRFAMIPADALEPNRTYLITGAYDGDGVVELLVDGRRDYAGATWQSVQEEVTGPITVNTLPVCVGADPYKIPGVMRNHLLGWVQRVMVLGWPERHQEE